MPTTNLPRWDLSPFFKNTKDPKIQKTIQATTTMAQDFAKTYRSTIASLLKNPKKLKFCLNAYESIQSQLGLLSAFAQMQFDTQSTSHEAGAFRQRIEHELQAVQQHLVFFDVEFSKAESTWITQAAKSPELVNYQNFFHQIEQWKPHVLSEEAEQLSLESQLTGREAFSRLFDLVEGHESYRFQGKTLNQSEVLEKIHSPSSSIRKNAAAAFTQGLAPSQWQRSYIYNLIIQDAQLKSNRRKFEHPEASRHLANQISQPSVDALVKATEQSYPLVQRYYRLKKKLLKLPRLNDWDRYAPLQKTAQRFTFSQAQEIVLDCFSQFHPEFAKHAEPFFSEKRVDAPTGQGKRHGAYCMFIAPEHAPYVLLNFTGSVDDVMTMAHELGHGVHASLSRSQTALNYQTPLTVAETASIFAETVVFRTLASKLTKKSDRIALFAKKMESIFASVHRQIGMFQFERACFAQHAAQGELSHEAFAKLWRAEQSKMFGTSVNLSKNYDIWWSYISHFIHSPFYVYSYAFGELLTFAVMAQVESKGATTKSAYVDMLRAGGSKSPQDLLAPLNIDIQDPQFWNGGIRYIEEFLSELEEMTK